MKRELVEHLAVAADQAGIARLLVTDHAAAIALVIDGQAAKEQELQAIRAARRVGFSQTAYHVERPVIVIVRLIRQIFEAVAAIEADQILGIHRQRAIRIALGGRAAANLKNEQRR